MGKNKNKSFSDTWLNTRAYRHYINRLTELSCSMFEWTGLPDTIDPIYLELGLFERGQMLFFKDEVMGFLCLNCTTAGDFSVYAVPNRRHAYAVNGYNNELNEDNSVIIFNNYLRTNSYPEIEMFAWRLADLDRTIDVNARAQKTPVLIQCEEAQRLSLENVYNQIDGNRPVVYGTKNLDIKGINSIKTDAPYVCDKLYTLKTQLWNEALTYAGISNINIQKKERLITDEVTRNQGGTIASRQSRLKMRRNACKQINQMFGLNVWVNYTEDYNVDLVDDSDEDNSEDGDANE